MRAKIAGFGRVALQRTLHSGQLVVPTVRGACVNHVVMQLEQNVCRQGMSVTGVFMSSAQICSPVSTALLL